MGGAMLQPKLLPLLLLLLLQLGSLLRVDAAAAQGIGGGGCVTTSIRVTAVYGRYDTVAYSRFKDELARGRRRYCPRGTVCAQKFVSVKRNEATYSEDCWDENTMVEYTEIACHTDLCNGNLTFGKYPYGLNRNNFYPGSTIRCYNHGQVTVSGSYYNPGTYRYSNIGDIITLDQYRRQYHRNVPVTNWNRGMCGAAIYAHNRRSRLVHERVITGDRAGKFAMLAKCTSSYCDTSVVRDFLSSGYTKK